METELVEDTVYVKQEANFTTMKEEHKTEPLGRDIEESTMKSETSTSFLSNVVGRQNELSDTSLLRNEYCNELQSDIILKFEEGGSDILRTIKVEEESNASLVKEEHCNELENDNLIMKFEEGGYDILRTIKVEEELNVTINKEELKSVSSDSDGEVTVVKTETDISAFFPVMGVKNEIPSGTSRDVMDVFSAHSSQSQSDSVVKSDEDINQMDEIQRNNRSKGQQRLYPCFFCDKLFTRDLDLKTHLLVHIEEQRRHKCNICNKSFARRGDHNRHMLTHPGERSHTCDICNKSFTEGGTLNTHMRTHTEQSHTCDICNKSFTGLGTLYTHMRTHTGERPRPHKCGICNRSFIHRGTLENHMLPHTGQRPHEFLILKRLFTLHRKN